MCLFANVLTFSIFVAVCQHVLQSPRLRFEIFRNLSETSLKRTHIRSKRQLKLESCGSSPFGCRQRLCCPTIVRVPIHAGNPNFCSCIPRKRSGIRGTIANTHHAHVCAFLWRIFWSMFAFIILVCAFVWWVSFHGPFWPWMVRWVFSLPMRWRTERTPNAPTPTRSFPKVPSDDARTLGETSAGQNCRQV